MWAAVTRVSACGGKEGGLAQDGGRVKRRKERERKDRKRYGRLDHKTTEERLEVREEGKGRSWCEHGGIEER